MKTFVARYRKTIVAVIGAGVTIAAQYVAPQLVADLALVLTALGVYSVPNAAAA
jgi:hypothetical protein